MAVLLHSQEHGQITRKLRDLQMCYTLGELWPCRW